MRIKKKSKKRIIRHEQWIEIKRVNGKTVERRYPSNDDFEKLRLEMDPPPDLIYRRLNFVHGVPSEYRWMKPTPEMEHCGVMLLQRITLEEWPTLLERERVSGTDRVLPARKPVARPEELGPCPCAECTRERELGMPSRYSRNINIKS